MNSRTKDWFDAVSNGNIDQMQRLIRDEMPLDTGDIHRQLSYYSATNVQSAWQPLSVDPPAVR